VTLILRQAGVSPIYRDRIDYIVTENGREIGRMCEDRQAPQELRWFWSITADVDPNIEIRMKGHTTTLDHAKEQFRRSWERLRAIQG
jgi:hypothetical protein